MTVAELCRKEGIAQSMYYKWSKEFLKAGKSRMAGNIKRQADSAEVTEMCKELEQFKLLVAELSLKNRTLKKSLLGLGTRRGTTDTTDTGREDGDHSPGGTIGSVHQENAGRVGCTQ
jgi:transposase-like protein